MWIILHPCLATPDFPDPNSEAPALNLTADTQTPSLSENGTTPIHSTPSPGMPPAYQTHPNHSSNIIRDQARFHLIKICLSSSQDPENSYASNTKCSLIQIVIGHDIPPIEMSSGSVSVWELEDAVEKLRVRMETNKKSDLSALAEEMRQDEAMRVEELEHKNEDIGQLKASVTNLKSQVTDLCAQLSTIVEDIQVQEEVLKGLMSVEEGDENGSITSSEL
ncbi:uncharacterized protein MELLADRAFT_69833 [Melampsora larici-populina 98AG31]|uniref:Uncharacterized protein n=1 Tax=Melampsora larici-populina (strain 98AG31 / pathotype 3-4-7) TaxID=747676 RepID=F4SCD8_MELLP|nr:uncharacterized protein MELLADRAFT_69833 [Melampsora larici-populina 98AG31]EGF97692.1 hypothetical protein MELLADRAFT_69833 [Melampsora larici-populina 98AG31]